MRVFGACRHFSSSKSPGFGESTELLTKELANRSIDGSWITSDFDISPWGLPFCSWWWWWWRGAGLRVGFVWLQQQRASRGGKTGKKGEYKKKVGLFWPGVNAVLSCKKSPQRIGNSTVFAIRELASSHSNCVLWALSSSAVCGVVCSAVSGSSRVIRRAESSLSLVVNSVKRGLFPRDCRWFRTCHTHTDSLLERMTLSLVLWIKMKATKETKVLTDRLSSYHWDAVGIQLFVHWWVPVHFIDLCCLSVCLSLSVWLLFLAGNPPHLLFRSLQADTSRVAFMTSNKSVQPNWVYTLCCFSWKALVCDCVCACEWLWASVIWPSKLE